jgi:Tol biopolymer transport system component
VRRALAMAILLLQTVGGMAVHGSNTTEIERKNISEGRIAFVRSGDLWVWEAGKERQVTSTGKVSNPRFSESGRYIAYLQGNSLWVVPISGGSPWQIGERGTIVHPAVWSPTDDTLAFTTIKEGVFSAQITRLGPEKLSHVAVGWSSPAWSPDGKELAVARQKPGKEKFTGTVAVATVPRIGGRAPIILEERYPHEIACGPVGPITSLKWSSDGEWLAFYRQGLYESGAADCNQLVVVPIKGGTPVSVGMGPANPEWFAWAPTGAVLAFTDGAGRAAFENKVLRVATMPPRSPFRSFTPAGYADREPSWSQDGRQLAFTRSLAKWPVNMNHPAPEQAIWVMNVATGNGRQVLGSEGGIGPRWGTNEGMIWARREKDGSSLWYQSGPDIQPHPLVQGIDLSDSYYGQWSLSQVFDWWLPKEDRAGAGGVAPVS